MKMCIMQHPIAPGTTAGEKSVDLICDAVWCYIMNSDEETLKIYLFFFRFDAFAYTH